MITHWDLSTGSANMLRILFINVLVLSFFVVSFSHSPYEPEIQPSGISKRYHSAHGFQSQILDDLDNLLSDGDFFGQASKRAFDRYGK